MLIRIIKEVPNLYFVQYRKIFFLTSLTFAFLSIVFLFFKGLNFGIDFRGGLLIEIKLNKNTSQTQIRNEILKVDLGDFVIQSLDNSKDNFLLKMELNNNQEGEQEKLVNDIKSILNSSFGEDIDFRRVEYVGPTVSKELITTGILAILTAIFCMLVYIWFRFELPFAIGAVIALIHDTTLTVGMFSITSLEFNLSTVAAILLIIGYSMNDTVVVYDRIRENLKKFKKIETINLLNKSINETLARTINTTATTILALLALYFFGGNIIKDFSLAMIWGIIIGTYSSILIATPILLNMKIRKTKREEE